MQPGLLRLLEPDSLRLLQIGVLQVGICRQVVQVLQHHSLQLGKHLDQGCRLVRHHPEV
jgi:hypothetical protein